MQISQAYSSTDARILPLRCQNMLGAASKQSNFAPHKKTEYLKPYERLVNAG